MVVSAFLVVFFASSKAKVQNFVQQPYCNWTKFNDKVKAHAASTVHCESVIAMKSFEEVHSGMQHSIDTLFSRDQQRLFRTNCSCNHRLHLIVWKAKHSSSRAYGC